MCIIMSLNVNEMELKDPKQRTCGMLHKERREGGKFCDVEEKKGEKCHFWGRKHLISWPTRDNERRCIYKQLLQLSKTFAAATDTPIKRGWMVGAI